MTIHLGNIPASTVLYIPFATYDGTTGASETCSGLAVTDIEIYKNGSTTQRSSDAGYTLLDTDGIDFDGITGINGFSVDLADNTDAGFYSAGAFYWVVVSSITADAVTVNFIAATFRIVAAEAITGKPKVDVDALLGTAWLTPGTAGTPDVNAKLAGGTAWGSGAITAASIAADAITAAKIADGAIDAATFAAGAINAAAIASDAITDAKVASDVTIASVTGAVGSVTAAITLPTIPTAWITADGIATDAIGSAELAASAITEIQSGLSTLDAAGIRTAVGLASANLDTQLDAMPTNTELATALGTADDAVLTAIAALNNLSASGLFTSQMTESYAADGTAPTMAQCLYLIQQSLHEFAISSTTRTVKKLDGSTTAAVFTLDSASAPTSTTRSA